VRGERLPLLLEVLDFLDNLDMLDVLDILEEIDILDLLNNRRRALMGLFFCYFSSDAIRIHIEIISF
jgi:hypothetical protein